MRPLLLMGLLPGLLAAGCDSENVEWTFVSNPSGNGGSGGGAVIVIRTDSSSSASISASPGLVTASGHDDRGPVTVRLLAGGDVAMLERPGALEIRSPVLPTGHAELRNAVLTSAPGIPFVADVAVPDAARIDPLATGGGRLHIAGRGTLLVLEHAGGVSAFGLGEPVRAPIGTTVQAIGSDPALLSPDGRLTRLLPVPPAPVEAQVRASGDDRLEVLGPRGEVLARLPAAPVTLHHGEGGLLLTARFPGGVGGDPTPIALTVAAHDRYLLRVE